MLRTNESYASALLVLSPFGLRPPNCELEAGLQSMSLSFASQVFRQSLLWQDVY